MNPHGRAIERAYPNPKSPILNLIQPVGDRRKYQHNTFENTLARCEVIPTLPNDCMQIEHNMCSCRGVVMALYCTKSLAIIRQCVCL